MRVGRQYERDLIHSVPAGRQHDRDLPEFHRAGLLLPGRPFFDPDVTGEAGEQAVLLRQLDDLRLHRLLFPPFLAGPCLVAAFLQVPDALPRPEDRDGVALRLDRLDRERPFLRGAVHSSPEGYPFQPVRVASDLYENRAGPPREEDHFRRRLAAFHPAGLDDGGLEIIPECLAEEIEHLRLDPLPRMDEFGQAAPGQGQPFQQELVRPVPDADGGELNPFRVLPDQLRQPLLVSDLAVGDENDEALAPFPGRSPAGVFQRGVHLGAAQIGLRVGNVFQRLVEALVAVFDRPVEEVRKGGAEPVYVEVRPGVHGFQADLERLLRLGDRTAAHRAGAVENEDDLAPARRAARGIFRLRQREINQDKIAATVGPVGEPRLPPHHQHEIAVQLDRLDAEGHLCRFALHPDADRVARRFDRFQAAAVTDLEAYRDSVRDVERVAGVDQVVHRDARFIRLVGREIARRDGGRQHETDFAAVRVQGLDVLGLHHHLGLRFHVPDREGEDVRPFLVQQEAAVSFGEGPVILFEGLVARLDRADDRFFADPDGEAADGRRLRQRELVNRLDGLLLAVDEPLADADAGGAPGNGAGRLYPDQRDRLLSGRKKPALK
ncbi:MAG: hypothetical protein BWY73_00303 [candidate division TA06 bacterium ADurb.Bin417]|uniref:Uncharacterized protein n=1 Tax=candidate division TA06 bacterium ADurb.Bin417 TaxID=1852828 RepID=A0A1V5MKX9_UNCT6|nr:MAG: hypothetical protein BWY73_00303 [candidate division TA06 bacterium ADurb.Bin417]